MHKLWLYVHTIPTFTKQHLSDRESLAPTAC